MVSVCLWIVVDFAERAAPLLQFVDLRDKRKGSYSKHVVVPLSLCSTFVSYKKPDFTDHVMAMRS